MKTHKKINMHQKGFSLVELMVGLVIGLFATLVIMQVFSVFEGQKRSTSGTADAQTNGTIALMQLQRHLQTAGYGMPMPMADLQNNVLNCITADATALFPVQIVDGQNGSAGDRVVSRYSTNAAGGGVPVQVVQLSNATVGDGMQVTNNIGCNSDAEMSETVYNETFQDLTDTAEEALNQAENRVMILDGNQCFSVQIAQQPSNVGDVSSIRLVDQPALTQTARTKVACLGNYGGKTFDVVGNELTLNGDPVVSEVVSMQAQYGVSSTASSNAVIAWVDAVGTWATPSIADRNRIKAVRVAVVLRNGLKEKENVTTVAPKAWIDSGSTTIDMDVSFLPDWQRYRYRVFGTTVPLRNMIWSKGAM